MVFPESWKRSCPNFYAHDCKSIYKYGGKKLLSSEPTILAKNYNKQSTWHVPGKKLGQVRLLQLREY